MKYLEQDTPTLRDHAFSFIVGAIVCLCLVATGAVEVETAAFIQNTITNTAQ